MVRTGHRPERRLRQRPAGPHRPARPERRGEVDLHESDHRPAETEQRQHHRSRRADLAEPGPVQPHRLCPEQDSFYERMTGREWVTALVRLNGVSEADAAAMAARAIENVELTE